MSPLAEHLCDEVVGEVVATVETALVVWSQRLEEDAEFMEIAGSLRVPDLCL